jgi:FMN phosphatase YigB (HAD superfamily)
MGYLKNITCDFDGVFYKYDFLGKEQIFNKMIADCLATSVAEVSQNKDPAELDKLIKLSQDDFEIYLDLISQGLSPNETVLVKQMSQAQFHKNLYRLITPHIDLITAEAKFLKNDFYKIKDKGVMFGILSLADEENWIAPLLNAMTVADVFSYIIDYRKTGFIYKGTSSKPIDQALAIADSTAAESGFVEDNIDNIKVAKEKHGELTTIWVNHKHEIAPSEVTYSVNSFASCLQKLDQIT